nr:DPP IV N-terminal domain-containing protein [Rhodothermaceae bacterium]
MKARSWILSLLCIILIPTITVHAYTTEDDSTKSKNKDLPLKAERTISFTTDEGSWISLDVSPDGQQIVFDMLGDLYTLPLSGGTATRLTEGMHYDAQPRFSPDGKKVLYVSDYTGSENLWTIDLESKETTQVTKDKGKQYMSPDWTPDGDYVIASKGESRLGVVKLWMGHIDGGSGKSITPKPDNLKTVGGAVSPDGRHIWFARRQNSWNYNASLPQYQLAVYDRDNGETYGRTSRYGSAFRPTLSPDGKWLVYGSRMEDQTGLRIRDLNTGDEQWLAYPVQRDEQESIADQDVLPGMSFTPDSKEVVASYGGKIWRIPIDGSDAIPVPFEVNVELGMGPLVDFDYAIPDDPTFIARQIRDAVPSPDGSQLAFTVLNDLYIMDYPDGEPQRLTESSAIEAQPTWSPDGEWLAYVTWTEEGGHMFKVRADGRGNPTQLTTQRGIFQQPVWASNGRIVAVRGPAKAYMDAVGPFAFGAASDLVWIPSDGGDHTLIAPTEGRSRPHFTSSSDRIYLHHSQKGLLSIRWDGTDEKVHVKVVGNKRPQASQPNSASITMMAPEGDQALAQVNQDIYVVTVPYVGGDAPTISVANPSSAPFPAKKLTDIGGQFPTWGHDGRTIHWSIGNAHVVYDLDREKAVSDSLAAVKKAEEESSEEESEEEIEEGDEGQDTNEASEEEKEDEEKKDEAYKPHELRIQIAVQRDIPEGTVLLQGARIITMKGDEVIEEGDVLIRNNRIEAIGEEGSLEVPRRTRTIDVSGMTIVPGFVDTHAHLRPAWNVHKPQSWAYLANLAYGVTTTRDPQTGSTDVITYGDLVDTGAMVGPRIYSTG